MFVYVYMHVCVFYPEASFSGLLLLLFVFFVFMLEDFQLRPPGAITRFKASRPRSSSPPAVQVARYAHNFPLQDPVADFQFQQLPPQSTSRLMRGAGLGGSSTSKVIANHYTLRWCPQSAG